MRTIEGIAEVNLEMTATNTDRVIKISIETACYD